MFQKPRFLVEESGFLVGIAYCCLGRRGSFESAGGWTDGEVLCGGPVMDAVGELRQLL